MENKRLFKCTYVNSKLKEMVNEKKESVENVNSTVKFIFYLCTLGAGIVSNSKWNCC